MTCVADPQRRQCGPNTPQCGRKHLTNGDLLRPPKFQALAPGMVVTIDPGLYVQPAPGVPERYWNIGIRIEDDALVTATGCELMSRDVPVAAAEIEALMRDSRGGER